MNQGKCRWVLTILGLASSGLITGCAQTRVSGDRAAIVTPVVPETEPKTRRRDRNPYFAARPVYPPTPRGARANVTFEPFTRWYYPNERTYYPPLDEFPSIRSR